jgi:pyruvate/2-oxoglutarate dehydrogenase complex dihydrolipoamide acyltransferase (E2) component
VRRASGGGVAAAEATEPKSLRAVPDPRPAAGGATSNVVPLPRGALEERTPLKGIRKRIFENMARSKQKAAHFTFVEECDVGALKELRKRLTPAAEKQGIKLTFLPFIVKAVVAALRRHPTLNQTFDEATQEIVTRRYYNIGIAAATEAGLVVPVVKNASERSLLDIAKEIERLAEDARKNRLKLEDVQGSTFTITSLGAQGGLFATPVINFPEVAILGVHQMKKKPVVRNDQIVIGEVMLLSLSFDHRLVDGHIGAAFAYELIGLLENPESMFLEMV